MRYDEISLKVREIVANLFERDAATLSDDTLLMQDLPCESIDLLEVSVQLGATFHIFVDEERAFLRSLRYQLAGAPDAAAFLREHYGHLDEARRQVAGKTLIAMVAAGRLLYGCRRHGPAIAPDPGRHRPLGGTGP